MRHALLVSHRAHPRSRGENTALPTCSRSFVGSSPLTRGKLAPYSSAIPSAGLIPAHAGKTPSKPRAISQPGAHPRSRGENLNGDLEKLGGSGSSPLTRGKPRPSRSPCAGAGLIPAHAGKTATSAGVCMSLGAHPRSRGENPALHLIAWSIEGSSPLTRGKPRPTTPAAPSPGLIPAHAGKT